MTEPKYSRLLRKTRIYRVYSSARNFDLKILKWMCIVLMAMSISSLVSAEELVKDERRLWSDGSPQEVWTYQASISPDSLILKELFYESGAKRREEQFAGGLQHGTTTAWYEEGSKEVEENWKDGGRHGLCCRDWCRLSYDC